MLIDTHAHLHHEGLSDRTDVVLANAAAAGVNLIINVGVTEEDSRQAVTLAHKYDNVFATVGLHPQDAESDNVATAMQTLEELAADPKVVAIGECGLDYYRGTLGRSVQEPVFRAQIDLALKHDLPMVWHVRPSASSGSTSYAFDDFFEITDQYPNIRGIVHCFTSTRDNLDKAVERGFLVALNGIMTFTKEVAQLEVVRAVPLENLVLETDCPFLTPVPMRGKVNESAFLRSTAEFIAKLRGESLEDLARATTNNAKELFKI